MANTSTNPPKREIIIDDADQQVQKSPAGTLFFYRKDFIAGGDRTEEYSLALMYAKEG